MRILYTASEVAPFAKTGGLADVAGALPAALSRLGHEVKVILPKYGVVDEKQWNLRRRGNLLVKLAGQIDYPFTIWSCDLPGTQVEVLFLANDRLFGRQELYQEQGKDYPDNLERFSAFSRAVLEVPKLLKWSPDVLHTNDWQMALSLTYLKAHFAEDDSYQKMGTLLTLHNLGYQGLFPGHEFSKLGLPPEYFTSEILEFYGMVNLLKAGIVLSEILNTVSPTYSREIQTMEFGHGLEGVLRSRQEDLFGILNGVDYEQWDPAHDPYIRHSYDHRYLHGKRLCKEALQRECKMPVAAVPLIGIITRFTIQKGIDLVIEILDELMKLDLQMVVLGAGNPDIHQKLAQAMNQYPEKFSVHFTFDEPLAHRIEAGADLFLMPSRYEPCGLSQLYSLRYGTVPIVRKTGGLADTVTDATPSNIASRKATGFVFEAASSHSLLTTLRLALHLYKDRSLWEGIMLTAMAADFSWERSAHEYVRLYELATAKARKGRSG
ncbi:MAG: glycogen synthase GlgA [Nitrospira sp.]|nr:glycogen synthase GlgA [Nitrospira sp.]